MTGRWVRQAVILGCATGSFLCLPTTGAAQPSSPSWEAFVTIGWGKVWRYEGPSFGEGPNVGAGVAIRTDSGFGVALQLDHTFPKRRGAFRGVTALTANLQYSFGDHRVQPYLSAGLGLLRSVPDTAGVDKGFGPNLGAGLRVDAHEHVPVRAEIQWLEGAWLSPLNLSVTRISAGTGYSR
jgi:opacity protein-like surface antigen